MPRQYEAIRNRFARQGLDYDEAQTHAAKIYNAAHLGRPMSAAYEGMKRKARRHALLRQMRGHG